MLILWILTGALCGWIAALLSRTNNNNFDASFYLTIGIIGSLIGGLISQAYGRESVFLNPISLLMAILISSVFLAVAKLLMRRA